MDGKPQLLGAFGMTHILRPARFGAIGVDWSNSLTSGLTHAIVFNEATPRNLVDDTTYTLYGNAAVGASGLSLDESGDYMIIPNLTLNNQFTVIAGIDLADNTGSLYQYWFSFGTFFEANTFNAYVHENGLSIPGVQRVALGPGSDYTNTAYWPTYNGEPVAIRVDGATTAWHWGGITPAVTIDGSASAMANGTTRNAYVGGRSDLNADRFTGGSIQFLYIWNNTLLSESDAHNINADPFQFIKNFSGF